MNNKGFLVILILLSLSIILFIRSSIADSSNQLIETTPNVATSNGTLTFQNGTLIGGDPSNYIVLTESRVFQTATGSQEYPNGTKIDCNPPPGYPNPCNAS